MFSSASEPSSLLFQTYLLPALPFRRPRLFCRRRKSSSDTTHSTNSTSSANSGDSYDTPSFPYLAGHASTISCSRCHADLALTSQIISKGFTGRHGRAYLVSPSPLLHPSSTSNTPSVAPSLPNTNTHKPVARNLVTGLHTVSDVSCALCGSLIGWKYVGAEEESQRYKVGKFILESKRTGVGSCWEMHQDEGFEASEEYGDVMPMRSQTTKTGLNCAAEEEVMFDSQDEEECEDLFSGIWSPALAKKRKNRRIVGLK